MYIYLYLVLEVPMQRHAGYYSISAVLRHWAIMSYLENW